MDKKILIVDDEEALRNIFKTVLEKEGYMVTAAGSAEKALEVMEEESFMVMFLDLNLPRMNGVELCKKIREDNPVPCIYAVTGFSSLFELVNCREAGFDDYFVKPIKMDMLKKIANESFEKISRWRKR